MVHAARDFSGIRDGSKPAVAAVFALGNDVRGDADQPAGDGFCREAHDGEPAQVDPKYVVVAAVGRDQLFAI